MLFTQHTVNVRGSPSGVVRQGGGELSESLKSPRDGLAGVDARSGQADGLVGHHPAAASSLQQPADRGERWRWLFLGDHRDPPVGVTKPIEDPKPGRVGICCSGGGIRSASFNLGALQAIQESGRL